MVCLEQTRYPLLCYMTTFWWIIICFEFMYWLKSVELRLSPLKTVEPSYLVSRCFEPRQPEGITRGLINLSPEFCPWIVLNSEFCAWKVLNSAFCSFAVLYIVLLHFSIRWHPSLPGTFFFFFFWIFDCKFCLCEEQGVFFADHTCW